MKATAANTDFETFIRNEYQAMAHSLPMGLYLTPRVVDGQQTKGWNGVVWVHSGPYAGDHSFKFRIDFPQFLKMPVVKFSTLQVYHPYVSLDSGQL